MGQYVHWDGHHSMFNKNSVYSTPTLRAQTGSSKLQLLGHEYQHIKTALSRCNYPDRVFNRLYTKMDYKLSLQHHNNYPKAHRDTNKNEDILIVVPYSKGLNKSFKNICRKVGVQVHFKGNNTAKDLLMAPMDRDSIFNKGGVIYRYMFDHIRCTMEYIGETGRNFGAVRGTSQDPSPIFDHSKNTGHSIKLDNFCIVDSEPQGITMTTKEVMYIRVNDPPLNRNLGKYELLHIWNEVLQDMLALHLQ